MTPAERAALIELLKAEEGCELTAYWDPIGRVWTCGYGATGPDIAEGTVWTQEQADARLEADADRAITNAHALDFFRHLSPLRQRAVACMVYQLGLYGVQQFRRFCDAMRRGEWYIAAIEALDSRWHRSQTAARAERMAFLIMTGIELPKSHTAVQRVLAGVLDEVNRRRAA